MKAIVYQEGETPHAHIYYKDTYLGRLFSNGTMDTSLEMAKDATKFLRDFSHQILRLIEVEFRKP
jgi:hypothetical protein